MKTYAVLFGLAFLAGLIGTPLLRRLGTRFGFLDSAITPGAHERRPVPRLGGVVIYFALLGALLALFLHSNAVSADFRSHLSTFWSLWGPATLILLVGVADDIWGMNAWVKFLGQIGAAVWLISAGITVSHLSLPWGGRVDLGWLSAGVTLLWLVGLTNAFNFIDGVDGLAAGVGFLAAGAIAATGMMTGNTAVVILTVALAGALLGFLRHNFTPATIFLGDSGSMFIGFVLAAGAVAWHQKVTTAIAVAAPLAAFALPLADTALAVLRRTARGQPLFVSDRHHIHHRLLALGLQPRQVVLLLYAVSAATALACVLIARGHNLVTGLVLLVFIGTAWVGVRRLGYPEFAAFGPVFSPHRLLAHMRLQETADRLREASTPAEFWQRLQANPASLDLDWLALELGPDDRARLPVLAAGPSAGAGGEDSRDGSWRLRVPLGRGSVLTLGRRPQRKVTDLPMELIAEELRSAVEQVLVRSETPAAESSRAASPQTPARWAPTEKEVV